jgi:hypothetical protein
MIKKITTAFIFFIALSIYGQQEKINNYKYVIVPDKFSFLKQTDQYQTSSLTKFLLKKKGFIVFLSNENLPSELVQNRCLGLIAEVLDDSGMFTVKNQLQFKDCYGAILYTSEIGRSKEKDYKKAYHDAIRKAYNSMTDLEYSYQPKEKSKKEIIKTKVLTPVKKEIPVRITGENKKIKISKTIIKKNKDASTKLTISKNILYAQAIENGFQLVNTSPAVVFQVLKTKVATVFIIKNKNGILYKNKTNWIAEYYNNNTLVVEKYQIKF